MSSDASSDEEGEVRHGCDDDDNEDPLDQLSAYANNAANSSTAHDDGYDKALGDLASFFHVEEEKGSRESPQHLHPSISRGWLFHLSGGAGYAKRPGVHPVRCCPQGQPPASLCFPHSKPPASLLNLQRYKSEKIIPWHKMRSVGSHKKDLFHF